MAYLTINGINFSPLHEGITQGSGLQNGRYYAHGQYGKNPAAGAPVYKEQIREYTGEDGVATVGHDFRGRPIYCTCIWVGTESGATTLYKSDQESFKQQARYSITLPGGTTYQGCKLPQGGDMPPDWGAMDSKSLVIQGFMFMQMSLTN